MLKLTLADLVHRRRQFLIAVLGTALVLGMALVMSGMSNSFRTEIRTTIDDVGADRWVIAGGASGPTTGFSPIPAAVADELERRDGVTSADAIAFVTQTATSDDVREQVNMWAHEPDGLGAPDVADGRSATGAGEVVVDRRLRIDVGRQVTIAGEDFEVVGRTSGHSMFGGIPNVYMQLADAQRLLFDGAPLATAVAVQGDPGPVDGLEVLTNDDVRGDSLRTMADAIESVDTTRAFMWAVAAVIIAGLMFVSALERVRDFAVLKAVGASSRYLFASLALQSVIVALLAAVMAAGISTLLQPMFALPIVIPLDAFLALPVVAVVVGLLSSLAGLRRAVGADPALAFS